MGDERQQGSGRQVRLPAGYESVYDREGRKIAGSPASIGWKMPVIAAVLALAVAAGVTLAIYEAEPLEAWRDLREVKVASDEGFVYLQIRTGASGDAPNWEEVAYSIALDTYDPARGVKQLPASGEDIGSGAEFLLEIQGPDQARLSVVRGYNPFAGGPIASPRNGSAFEPLRFVAHRERYARDGTKIPQIILDRGVLQFGSEDPDDADFSTLTDISVGEGGIEIRIPWGLLNVADPSTGQVLHYDPGSGSGRYTNTDGLRIYVFSHPEDTGKVADAIPNPGTQAPAFRWETWREPSFRIEPKHGTEQLTEALNAIPDHPDVPPMAETPPQAESQGN